MFYLERHLASPPKWEARTSSFGGESAKRVNEGLVLPITYGPWTCVTKDSGRVVPAPCAWPCTARFRESWYGPADEPLFRYERRVRTTSSGPSVTYATRDLGAALIIDEVLATLARR